MSRSARAGWVASIAFLALVGSAFAAAPRAARPAASAEAVYAAFTVNLTRFVTWPDSAFATPDAPFVIGTFARDPINPELEAAVRGESVGGHPVRTIRLQSPADAQKCHLVFISSGTADPQAVLARVKQRPVLTISDADNFLAQGGHVHFVPQPPHTRLQISAANLHACGLEARSQLLRLATAP